MARNVPTLDRAPSGKQSLKRDEAARRIWPVLTDLAARRQTITYSALADRIGSVDHRHGWALGLIQAYCLNVGLPPLTILVISKTHGQPGHGFIALEDEEREAGKSAVWTYPWPSENPFAYAVSGAEITALASRVRRDPETADEVYRLVRSRGVAQIIFRKAVIDAYQSRCAFCGISFTACLEAAHIIPWTAATPAERISPTNGLCLCVNHHRMFDAGLMVLGPAGQIVCEQPKSDGSYSPGDRSLTTRLEGKPAFLPHRRNLRPAAASLAWRYRSAGWDQAPWSLEIVE